MKLLLADDDADQLELRALSLAKAGFEVVIALDEKTALRVAEETKPEVAVVDLRMPTQEVGLRLIRELKARDQNLRIVLLTGANPKILEILPERALIEHVLTKGNATKQLVAYLKKDLILEVKVIPRSSKSEIIESPADGVWKVKLRAVPEKGQANQELIALLASHFKISKDAIEILTGETAARKRLRLKGLG